MTRQEFIKNTNRYRNAVTVSALVALVCLFVPVGFMAWLDPNRSELPHHVWTILNIAAFVVIAAGYAFMFVRMSRLSKPLGLCCPQCKKSVVQMSAVVIATGKCGHCGARVLDETV